MATPKKGQYRRRIVVQILVVEDRKHPWGEEDTAKWLVDSLDKEAKRDDLITVERVWFPDGRLGEYPDVLNEDVEHEDD